MNNEKLNMMMSEIRHVTESYEKDDEDNEPISTATYQEQLERELERVQNNIYNNFRYNPATLSANPYLNFYQPFQQNQYTQYMQSIYSQKPKPYNYKPIDECTVKWEENVFADFDVVKIIYCRKIIDLNDIIDRKSITIYRYDKICAAYNHYGRLIEVSESSTNGEAAHVQLRYLVGMFSSIDMDKSGYLQYKPDEEDSDLRKDIKDKELFQKLIAMINEYICNNERWGLYE